MHLSRSNSVLAAREKNAGSVTHCQKPENAGSVHVLWFPPVVTLDLQRMINITGPLGRTELTVFMYKS